MWEKGEERNSNLFNCLCSFWYNQMMMTILTVTGKTRREFQGQMSVELRLEILITEARKLGFGSWTEST